MKITLYTNPFMHDGKKHVSVSIMVRRSDTDIVSCFTTQAYAKVGNVFDASFQTLSTARALIETLQALGHTVEADPLLTGTTEPLSDHLIELVLP